MQLLKASIPNQIRIPAYLCGCLSFLPCPTSLVLHFLLRHWSSSTVWFLSSYWIIMTEVKPRANLSTDSFSVPGCIQRKTKMDWPERQNTPVAPTWQIIIWQISFIYYFLVREGLTPQLLFTTPTMLCATISGGDMEGAFSDSSHAFLWYCPYTYTHRHAPPPTPNPRTHTACVDRELLETNILKGQLNSYSLPPNSISVSPCVVLLAHCSLFLLADSMPSWGKRLKQKAFVNTSATEKQ